jgi:hypothetical protein
MGVDADGWFIYGWTGLLLGPFVQLQQKGCEKPTKSRENMNEKPSKLP